MARVALSVSVPAQKQVHTWLRHAGGIVSHEIAMQFHFGIKPLHTLYKTKNNPAGRFLLAGAPTAYDF